MLQFCQWLDQTSAGTAIRQSLWLFPAIETVHLLGMAVLMAAITVLDLRLLGLAVRQQQVSKLATRLIPLAWLGFAVQLVTGALLFSSEAVKIYGNPAFRLKMLLLLLAGMQALVFQIFVLQKLPSWDTQPTPPIAGKLIGVSSILLWIGIVTAGRFIGFM